VLERLLGLEWNAELSREPVPGSARYDPEGRRRIPAFSALYKRAGYLINRPVAAPSDDKLGAGSRRIERELVCMPSAFGHANVARYAQPLECPGRNVDALSAGATPLRS